MHRPHHLEFGSVTTFLPLCALFFLSWIKALLSNYRGVELLFCLILTHINFEVAKIRTFSWMMCVCIYILFVINYFGLSYLSYKFFFSKFPFSVQSICRGVWCCSTVYWWGHAKGASDTAEVWIGTVNEPVSLSGESGSRRTTGAVTGGLPAGHELSDTGVRIRLQSKKLRNKERHKFKIKTKWDFNVKYCGNISFKVMKKVVCHRKRNTHM